MFVLDEVDFDAMSLTANARHGVVRVDCGMTFLSETVLDAAAAGDPVQDQVGELARLILASANPVEVEARVQTLLRDRLAHPTPPTGRP